MANAINLTVHIDYDKVIERLKAEGWVIPVRCADCRYYRPQNKSARWNCTARYCTRCAVIKMPPDGYCSFGERMGEEQE